MTDWWGNLSLRERGIVWVAGIVMLVVLLDSALISPLKNRNTELADSIAQAEDDLAWMREAVTRLPTQSRQSRGNIADDRVIGYLDQQITRMGLKSGMQQMVPMSNGGARIRLEEVEFSRLMNFFNQIDSAFSISEVRLQPSDTVGFVSASMVVDNRGN